MTEGFRSGFLNGVLPMDAETYNEVIGKIDDVRRSMETMRPDTRLVIVEELMRGYCRDCGDEMHGRLCHCRSEDLIG